LQRIHIERARPFFCVVAEMLDALRSRMISRLTAGSVPSIARLTASCAASCGLAIIQDALSR